MQKIAQFKKVSYKQFKKDVLTVMPDIDEQELIEIYDNIKLPRRATAGSAGYDFFSPFKIAISPNETIKIPTGIRVKMCDDWVLQCYPRSGLGFKYRMQLDNTVGIIDSDYYNSDNEGHIMVKFTNNDRENRRIKIERGQGYIQGIFVQYGITIDDNTNGIRNGGFGSTTK